MRDIKLFVKQFRDAIDRARDAGEFDCDFSFHKFPLGCCGDTSDLLAQFLLEKNIRTYYVCGTHRSGKFEDIQSHAWLITDSNIIIDITGDQFKFNPDFLNYDTPVYIGYGDNFHNLFEFEDRDIHENNGIDALGSMCQTRLKSLYNKIVRYI